MVIPPPECSLIYQLEVMFHLFNSWEIHPYLNIELLTLWNRTTANAAALRSHGLKPVGQQWNSY